MSKTRSFRLTPEAAENLKWAAERFQQSENKIVNLLLSDKHHIDYSMFDAPYLAQIKDKVYLSGSVSPDPYKK